MKMKIIICLLMFSFFLLVVAGSNVPSPPLSLDVNNGAYQKRSDIMDFRKEVWWLKIGVCIGFIGSFLGILINFSLAWSKLKV
jgi:uncharacterized membrane protein YfcA